LPEQRDIINETVTEQTADEIEIDFKELDIYEE